MRAMWLVLLAGCSGGLTAWGELDPSATGAPGAPTESEDPGFQTGPDGADEARDLSCTDHVANGAVPETISDTTAGGGDDLTTSCGANNGEEVVVAYVAPATGDYVFDLAGSTFDTTLAIKPDCGDAELACNDDWLPGSLSQVVVSLVEGETVLAVVEGRGVQSGGFDLNVDLLEASEIDCADGRDLDADGAVDCADDDCGEDPACALSCADAVVTGTLPQTLNHTTVGMGDDVSPSCANSNAPDMAVQFTAPSAGTYIFETAGSDFDTVLYARPGCFGAELACNDDGNGLGLQSRLVLDLAANETVVVVVDGFGTNSGNVVLTVR